MSEPGQGTDSEYEDSKGRIALWLQPEDVAWLAKHCVCGRMKDGNHTEQCKRLRYRAGTCLHAYGLEPKSN
jgi:hypothetical protein